MLAYPTCGSLELTQGLEFLSAAPASLYLG